MSECCQTLRTRTRGGSSVTVRAIAALLTGCFAAVQAEEDKSAYHLFNPTPRELMRGFETDRPDLTESPVTVDAGHFQIEADLVNYTYTKHQDIRQKDIAVGSLNLKAGLFNNMDLQVVLNPFLQSRIEDRATSPKTTTKNSGFGDLQVRAKVNIWGNDDGTTAFAVMPVLELPTGAEGLSAEGVQGGVIFPFSFELPAGFGAGMMWEVDFARDDTGRYHTEFVQSIAVGRDITKTFSAYVEFFSMVTTQTSTGWTGLFNFGFNYLLTEDLKLDTGLNMGVTSAAPDWNPFVGMSVRF